MASELRKSGISVVGDVPWGTHFCTFYETTQDLLDILVPFFKTGLENKEFCLWIISNSELLTIEEARNALRSVRVDLDSDLSEGRIELVRHDQWFLDGEGFDIKRVAHRFKDKLNQALAKGYAGMRVNGSPAWLYKYDDKELVNFERSVDELYPNLRIIASCTYPIPKSDAGVLLDVAEAHRFVITRRRGNWEILETPELMQAKQEIRRLNEELEQRVIERTRELTAANEELKIEMAERKRAEEALRESQRKLEEAQRIAHVGHWERDLDTDLIIWSDEIYRIFGLSPREKDLPLTEWRHMLHPEDRERVSLAIDEAQRGGRRYDVEYRIMRPDGEVRYVHSHGDVIRDEQGRPRRAFGIAQDLTERKRAEEALRKSENLWRTIFNDAAIGIAIVNPEGRPVETNPAFQKLLGYTKEELRHLWFVDFTHPDDTIKELPLHQEMIEGKRDHYQMEKRYIRKDGQVRWVNLIASVIPAEQPGEFFGVGMVEDITERKHAEEQLQTSTTQLRALSESLRRAREEEGIRIARELHDELGSALTSIKWSLLELDKVSSEEGKRGAREKIAEMVGVADSTINTVRRISSELRPGVLDELGLVAAVEWHAQQFEEHTGIVCRFDSLVDDVELNGEQATVVFRIFQEAMTNILRHAQATEVNILIEQDEGEFVIEIRDNGRGITESERRGIRSLGLVGMRERAHSIGGEIEINGIAGKGTVLIARFPIAAIQRLEVRHRPHNVHKDLGPKAHEEDS